MDAIQFRQRAARAREMAKSGDDIRLSRMLLDVAYELDAEADLMETEAPAARPGTGARSPATGGDADTVPIEVIDRAIFGKKPRTEGRFEPESSVNSGSGALALQMEVMVGSH